MQNETSSNQTKAFFVYSHDETISKQYMWQNLTQFGDGVRLAQNLSSEREQLNKNDFNYIYYFELENFLVLKKTNESSYKMCKLSLAWLVRLPVS